MDSVDELQSISPLRSPIFASSRALGSSRHLEAAASAPSPSRSPLMTARSSRSNMLPEMSVTEQIARKTRKSTVLDEKNALMILAIPDYDDYKIMQPYSCRSLSNKSKFVGGKDFVTRHNPQEVNDFKMQYSRDVGNLNRHRSIVAPPNTLLVGGASPIGGKTFAFLASQALGNRQKNQHPSTDDSHSTWKKTYTAGDKPCWVLTETGINQLIGPEYRITTRLALTTAREAPSPVTCRSPLRPETPFAAFTARESARIGLGVDLMDDKALATLSRSTVYSPASRPSSPPRPQFHNPAEPSVPTARSPSREGTSRRTGRTMDPSGAEDSRPPSRSDYRLGSPYLELSSLHDPPRLSPLRTKDIFHNDTADVPVSSPTLLAFAMEVAPPCVSLGTIEAGEVYLFPVRVRNVGSKQERYRVKFVAASVGGQVATIAEAHYDRETARLAPGLAAIVTLTLSFGRRGPISGQLVIDTEGVGTCDVRIEGTVR